MDNYREKVFNLIPSLRYLDGYEIYIWISTSISSEFSRDLQDSLICRFRYDIDDCEVDESDGEEDEVNGNEDGEGGGNEEDSEDGLLRALILYL